MWMKISMLRSNRIRGTRNDGYIILFQVRPRRQFDFKRFRRRFGTTAETNDCCDYWKEDAAFAVPGIPLGK
jgi:hypothetical protein